MLQNNFSLSKNTITLDKLKHNINNNNTPFSLEQTTFSNKLNDTQGEPQISSFQEIIKPTPLYGHKPYEMYSYKEKVFNPLLNSIKIDFNKNGQNFSDFNFLGRKKYMNKNENLIRNDQEEDILKIEEKENDNSLNLSAFKKIKINNKEQSYNSAFKNNILFHKNKIIKNKQKKKIINKIIINESNNITKNSENNNQNINPIKKHKIFKSISYDKHQNKEISQNNEDELSESRKKRRGRKPKSEIKVKRVHNASDYDNILRKIQVHFLSFIIYFANDLIEAFLPKNRELRFKNLNYDLKKTVSHSYVQLLKNKKIGEILQFQASSKNRKFDSSVNQQTFEKVCQLSPFLKNFFELSYLEVFNNYYYKSNRHFIFEGVQVNISQRTKVFIDLIQKNIGAAEKIKQITMNNFIENQLDYKLPIFVINKK